MNTIPQPPARHPLRSAAITAVIGVILGLLARLAGEKAQPVLAGVFGLAAVFLFAGAVLEAWLTSGDGGPE